MEIKGTAVVAIKEYVKSNFETDYKTWLDSLNLKSKEIFKGAVDATKWYSVEDGAVEPTVKLSTLFFGGNNQRGAWESGRYSAHRALTGIYKIFVKAASPSYIIERASRVFATYYRPCEIKVTGSTQNSCNLELTQMDEKYDVIENRISGWIEQALEISGCKNVKLEVSPNLKEPTTKEIFMTWE